MADTKRKILVVDDDVDIQNFCKIVLEGANFEVICFPDSAKAIDFLTENEVSLVITDLMMGGIDEGLQFVRKVRELKKGESYLPVIMMTGISSKLGLDITPMNEEDKKKMGVDEFLVKPLQPKHLLSAVKKLMGNSTLQ